LLRIVDNQSNESFANNQFLSIESVRSFTRTVFWKTDQIRVKAMPEKNAPSALRLCAMTTILAPMITVNPKLAASILLAVFANAEPMLSIGSAEGLSFRRA
jgi:hypothetical protein